MLKTYPFFTKRCSTNNIFFSHRFWNEVIFCSLCIYIYVHVCVCVFILHMHVYMCIVYIHVKYFLNKKGTNMHFLSKLSIRFTSRYFFLSFSFPSGCFRLSWLCEPKKKNLLPLLSCHMVHLKTKSRHKIFLKECFSSSYYVIHRVTVLSDFL